METLLPPHPVIHPTAVIDPSAQLERGVNIGPFVVIEAGVTVGRDTVLLTGTVLQRGSVIGERCRLGPYATVGGEPMDSRFRGEPSYAVLEDEVTLRDFASVHRATGEGAETRIGAGTLVMSYAHVSHNVQVGREVVLTTSVQLGGHCQVGNHAVIGSSSMLHQFCRVGSYAMYGAGSASNQDVLPYSMARGNPARHYRLNKVGLQRRGIDGPRYKALEAAIRAFRRQDRALLNALAEESPEVREMLVFRDSSRRGICRFV